MLTVLGVVVVVSVGLMVGVELSVAVFVNPILQRLPADGGLLGRSDGARVLGRVMPFWYVGSLALAAVWAVAAWGHTLTWAVVLAAALGRPVERPRTGASSSAAGTGSTSCAPPSSSRPLCCWPSPARREAAVRSRNAGVAQW